MIRKREGFTLIELLVVVAIIAILALIAVPNMLEAQVRAKVSRNKSDMRTIATALESYAVDNNSRYPPNYDTALYDLGVPSEYLTFAALSTPVAYITAAPHDVFRPDPNEAERERYFDYIAVDSVAALDTYPPELRPYYGRTGTRWCIVSIGPDKKHDLLGRELFQAVDFLYDPTNGTVSQGDFGRTNLGPIAALPN